MREPGARKELIVDLLELLVLLLFAGAVAGGVWLFCWPAALAAAAVVVGVGAWWMDRPPRASKDSTQ